jgi:hypothetical protein
MSFVFEKQYHWNEAQTGMAFLGLGSGSLLGLYVVYLWSDSISKWLAERHGEQRPEVTPTTITLILVSVGFVLLVSVYDADWPNYLWLVISADLALVILLFTL